MDNENMMQEFCCYFYDAFIMPQFVAEWEAREDCAEELEEFLKRMGITFDEFYHYVLSYSLGNGLQYMREVNDMIPLLSPIMSRNELEMDLSFHEDCVPGADISKTRNCPAPNTIPHGGENDGNIHQ